MRPMNPWDESGVPGALLRRVGLFRFGLEEPALGESNEGGIVRAREGRRDTGPTQDDEVLRLRFLSARNGIEKQDWEDDKREGDPASRRRHGQDPHSVDR